MKRIMLSFAVLAVGAAAYLGNDFMNTSETSLLIQNVEALAAGEGPWCIGERFRVTPTRTGWHCQNDAGNSCCPVR